MEKEYECSNCKNVFKREINRRGGSVSPKRRTFCSQYCSHNFWNKHNWDRCRKPDVSRKCLICEKEFVVSRRHVATHVCCSFECGRLLQERKNAQIRQEHRQSSANCQSCGNVFVPKDGVWSVQKYCSRKCYRRQATILYRQRHADRILLSAQKRKWGGNWIAALERDNWTCKLCGSQDRKTLIVHHLDGEGEAHSKNHALDNLQTLCHNCHHTRAHKHGTVIDLGGSRIVIVEGKKYKLVEEA